MTFLEAAIEVLVEAGRPLSVHELTERSIKQNLLSHQGRAPQDTMERSLKLELKKGDRSPFVQKSPGVFGLRHYDQPPKAKKAAPAPTPPPEAVAETAAETAAEEGAKKKRRRRGGRGRKRPGEAAAASPDGVAVESAAPEAGTPEEALAAEQLAAEADAPEAEEPQAVTSAAPPDEAAAAALDALTPVAPRRYPRIIDLPSEDVLTEQYAEEIAEGSIAPPAASETIDAQSADEDRLMLAEIKDEPRERRRGRGKERDRRGKGKERDKERDKKPSKAVPAVRAPEPPRAPPPPPRAPAASPPPVPPRAPAPVAAAAPAPVPSPAIGTDLEPRRDSEVVEVALSLLRSLNDPRPVHARQLAAMALKRKLLTGDPEEVWRGIRSALAGDARLRQAQGLRIRARHQGGGLFTLTSARLEDDVRAAEEALAGRWQELARLTGVALLARATKLPLVALEQLTRVYLDHAGFRDVGRVKRAGETWYLSGTQRRGSRSVRMLISVRAGGGEANRNAVGELRAGVEAKGLDEGLLLAPARLTPDGARELESTGAPITAYCGETFADELVGRGVGVVRAHLPVLYLDIDLLGELSES